MSTRAFIGIERNNEERSIEGVYNHSDGYPEYLGNVLYQHYYDKEDGDKTRQMVEMILSLGDISFLDEKLQNSRFYNTWRNEGTNKRTYHTFEEFQSAMSDSWYEYAYIYSELDNKWYFAPVPYGETIKVEDFKELGIGLIELEEEKPRICSECGKEMREGFCIDGGLEYYCSETCLHKNYTEKEWNEMYDDGNSDSYWTTWY